MEPPQAVATEQPCADHRVEALALHALGELLQSLAHGSLLRHQHGFRPIDLQQQQPAQHVDDLAEHIAFVGAVLLHLRREVQAGLGVAREQRRHHVDDRVGADT